MTPYYDEDGITIWHADCRDLAVWIFDPESGCRAAAMVTDPPYGIGYQSNSRRATLPASIQGDDDTSLRDEMLEWWGERPALVFGSWRRPRPAASRALLVWDTKGALGMGALDLPWKPAHQEVYVLGAGFIGRRSTDVLRYAPVQSMATNGRTHPHEKPIDLMCDLIGKCPAGSIIDPFCGSGSTLVAAKKLGRAATGIEVDERYCEIAARRLAQGVLFGPEERAG